MRTPVAGVGYDGRKLTPAVAPTRNDDKREVQSTGKETDEMVIEFFMPMEHVPTVTAQEHKVAVVNGKPRFYDPPELARAKANLIAALLARYIPAEKLTGPLHLHVVWCFLTDRHPDGAWRDTKPDTDNLQKLLKDCMTQVGFWEDDAQVCSELIEKRWVHGIRKGGTASGIWIQVKQLA